MDRRTVRINVGNGYDVYIENGIISRCGEILKKTAKWFVFSDGTIPDPDILKSYELKGKSKKEFLQLVTVH